MRALLLVAVITLASCSLTYPIHPEFPASPGRRAPCTIAPVIGDALLTAAALGTVVVVAASSMSSNAKIELGVPVGLGGVAALFSLLWGMGMLETCDKANQYCLSDDARMLCSTSYYECEGWREKLRDTGKEIAECASPG